MDENPRAPLAELLCSDILFRALPVNYLVKKDGTHHPKTFLRRETQDPQGLSLFSTIEGCKAEFERPIFGVRSLHVGKLRDHGFQVFPTSTTHANIRFLDNSNIPLRGEDEIAARNAADDLMELSRPISYWDEENADARFQQERTIQ